MRGQKFCTIRALARLRESSSTIGRSGAARERQNLAGGIALRRGLISAFRCDQFTSSNLGLFRVTALYDPLLDYSMARFFSRGNFAGMSWM
jgi:hypothetical protein